MSSFSGTSITAPGEAQLVGSSPVVLTGSGSATAHTGDVSVVIAFVIRSVRPAGARPVIAA